MILTYAIAGIFGIFCHVAFKIQVVRKKYKTEPPSSILKAVIKEDWNALAFSAICLAFCLYIFGVMGKTPIIDAIANRISASEDDKPFIGVALYVLLGFFGNILMFYFFSTADKYIAKKARDYGAKIENDGK